MQIGLSTNLICIGCCCFQPQGSLKLKAMITCFCNLFFSLYVMFSHFAVQFQYQTSLLNHIRVVCGAGYRKRSLNFYNVNTLFCRCIFFQSTHQVSSEYSSFNEICIIFFLTFIYQTVNIVFVCGGRSSV